MPGEKQYTIETLKKLTRGLAPTTVRNLLNITQNKSIKTRCDFVSHYLKVHGLDTVEGMENYKKVRVGGCKNCGKKK